MNAPLLPIPGHQSQPSVGREAARPWPLLPYFGALAFGVLSLALFTAALDGHEPNRARAIGQGVVLAAGTLRFAVARRRAERNRIWIGYCVLFAVSAPFWLIGEAILRNFVR